MTPAVKLIFMQRSTGYDWRPALSIADIENTISYIKKLRKGLVFMVDNCYGEFLEEREPTEVGADIAAGSLIKNPGGGLALTGGYIVGKKDLIGRAAAALTAPGLGKECGATLGITRSFLQGLFLAPHVVAEAIKGAVYASRIFQELGFEVSPEPGDGRSDIIQSIKFRSEEQLLSLPRYPKRGTGGQLCYTVPLGHARLRPSGDYGSGGLCPGFLHRAKRRRAHKGTLLRVFTGGTYLGPFKAGCPDNPAANERRGAFITGITGRIKSGKEWKVRRMGLA